MFLALSFLVLTGLSWVPTGAIVGFIGRRGFNLFFFQLICSIIGFLIGGVIGLVSPATLLPPAGIPASSWTGVLAGSLACGFFNYIMTFFMGRAMERGAGAMAYPVMVASCIIGFFPYGMLVLRERFNPIQLFGAVVGVAGIILGCL